MGAIVFDLDGTLVDSAPDIAAAANRMLAEFGHAPLPLPQLTSFIGHGIPRLVDRVMETAGIDPRMKAELNASMLAHYDRSPAALTKTYPHVRETLEALRADGHSLGVCTNKVHRLTVAILDALDLSPFFGMVIGGDSLPVKKPDPAPLHAAFRGLAGQPLFYVGDSEVDAETAAAARVDFALFTEGYRQAPVHELPHGIAFSRFDALLPYARARAQAAARGRP